MAFLAALLLAVLAATGGWLLFANFAGYDDEGYILLSAREYFAHGRLYDSVYSQYGPAFYVVTDAFQRLLAAPVDHTSARLLTLALWLGTAGACAALVLHQTASRTLALFALTTTFLFLYFITDEPFHPGALVIFTLAASLAALTALLARDRLPAAAAVAGATAAFLVLTKINVGVFYLAALGAWAALHLAPTRRPRLTGFLVVAALTLLAAALMHTLWRESWVQLYLLLFATGAATVVTALDRTALVHPRHAAPFLLAGLLCAAALLGIVWLRGTSLAGLLDGVLLGPLRHPSHYSYPVDWRPGSLGVAALSALLAFALPGIRRRFSAAAADRLLVTLRLLVATALLAGFACLMHARVIGALFSYVAPLIWIWITPLSGVKNPPAFHLCRGLLATVLLVQYLHAYPVAGSQESWATFLFWPLAALGLGEMLRWAQPRHPRLLRIWPALATLLIALLLAKLGWTAATAHARYASRSDLGLPGAARLHLPESQRTAYRILAVNAAAHADMLFSLPGMFSFNLWTGLPTPTPKNTTLWFSLLHDADQTAIIRAIAATPRTGLVVNDGLVQLMTDGAVPMRGPLHDYLRSHFVPVFHLEEFSFWVRRDRTIAPLGLARLGSIPASRETVIELCLASDGTPIHRLALHDLASPASAPLLELDASNTSVTAVSLDSANRPAGAPLAAPWPLHARGLTRLTFRFNSSARPLSPATTALHLIDEGGKRLEIARFSR